MGAWGADVFENDAACDSILHIRDSDDPFEYFRRALTDCASQEYIEVDEAGEALMTAFLLRGFVDRQYIEKNSLNSLLSYTKNIIDEFYAKWQDKWDSDEKNKQFDGKLYFEIAIEALHRVLEPEISEMSELWSEVNLFDEWKKTVDVLLDDLEEIKKSDS